MLRVVADELEVVLMEGDQPRAVVYGATKEEAMRLALLLRSGHELRLLLEQEMERHAVENDGWPCNCCLCDCARSYIMEERVLLEVLAAT